MANPLVILEKELLAQRERYNSLYALARRARPRLSPESFKHNLITYAAPLLGQVPEEVRGRVLSVLYELTLELSGLELFARSEAVCAVWSELLPGAVGLILESPETVIPALTNAAHNLQQEPGVDRSFWLQQMSKIAADCKDHRQWLEYAQVLAWVSGMAHYRESALEVARHLPDEMMGRVVPRWDKVKTDPWWPRRPAPGQMVRVHRVGGFVGFGGAFRKPPEVVAAGPDRFLVSDGTDDWLLFCDGFGATLKRALDFRIDNLEPPTIRVNESGEVLWAGERAGVPELAPVGSFDSVGGVVAVAGKLSHYVYLLLGTLPE
ncbi:MAG: hypothetical protein WC314_18395 [Vulcanimicrobiota bacterium]